MQCNFNHDACRNTANFKYAGQNLAWSKGYNSDKEAINIGIDGWWKEFQYCTMANVNKYASV